MARKSLSELDNTPLQPSDAHRQQARKIHLHGEPVSIPAHKWQHPAITDGALRIAARHFGVTRKELIMPGAGKTLVAARAIVCRVCYALGIPSTTLALSFNSKTGGQRDPSTIFHLKDESFKSRVLADTLEGATNRRLSVAIMAEVLALRDHLDK